MSKLRAEVPGIESSPADAKKEDPISRPRFAQKELARTRFLGSFQSSSLSSLLSPLSSLLSPLSSLLAPATPPRC